MTSTIALGKSSSVDCGRSPEVGSSRRTSYPATLKPYAIPFGTYRPGPPSISSTLSNTATSYATSIASDATIVPSRSSTYPEGQVSRSLLKIKVDTSVAPSSHIWDEFYAVSGVPAHAPNGSVAEQDAGIHGVEGSEATTRKTVDDGFRDGNELQTAGGTEANDLASNDALSELLSMFDMPHLPTHEFTSIDQHPTSLSSSSQSHQTSQTVSNDKTDGAQNGQYPGAEFLNLPDTASTIDNSNYPAFFDDFDFSHFTFPDNPSYPGNQTIATGSADNLQSSETSSAIGSSPLDGATLTKRYSAAVSTNDMHAEDHSKLLHQNHDQNYPTFARIPSDTTYPASCDLPAQHASVARTTSVHSGLSLEGVQNYQNNNTAIVPRWFSTGPALDHSVPSFPDKSQTSDRPQSRVARGAFSYSNGKTSQLFPHLARIEMRTLRSDKSVIAFQREVLRVAAEFYKSIAQVFESTPSEVLKTGMSDTGGVLIEDDTLADVLQEIKSLCSRLTMRAASLPGYPDEGEIVDTTDHNEAQTGGSHVQPSTAPIHPGHPRTGSASEPIDLTAPTPKSQDVHVTSPFIPPPGPDTASSHAPLSLKEYSPQSMGGAGKTSLAHLTQVDINPFTPESLNLATSVAPTAVNTPATYKHTPTDFTPNPPSRLSDTVARSSSTTPQPFLRHQASSSSPRRSVPPLPPLPSPSTSRLIHGPWKPSEVERLRTLVSFSTDVEDGAPIDHVDWTWVVNNFGGTRNRHQVLIKAVELGLRESSTHYSRKVKQKGYREALGAMQTDLHQAVNKPLTSPLPPLLPSAHIFQGSDSPKPGPVRRSTSDSPAIAQEDAPRKRYKLASSLSELQDPDDTTRRESSSTAPSEGLNTPEDPPNSRRPIPRALDLSAVHHDNVTSTIENNDHDRLATPKRPVTASLPLIPRTPKTPTTSIRGLAFKPYAHPFADTARPTTAHPATAPARSSYPRIWAGGWGVAALPGALGDGRPSVISPTYGTFGKARLARTWTERE